MFTLAYKIQIINRQGYSVKLGIFRITDNSNFSKFFSSYKSSTASEGIEGGRGDWAFFHLCKKILIWVFNVKEFY